VTDGRVPGDTSGVEGAAFLQEAADLAARRMTEYVELWESAMSRMAASDYHSEDFVDDWFAWLGKCMRDSTAMTTLAMQGYASGPRRQDDSGDSADGD